MPYDDAAQATASANKAAQPLDDALDQASSQGWGFFNHFHDVDPERMKRAAEHDRGIQMAKTAARLATDTGFLELLEFLMDHSLRRATFTAQLGIDPMQAYAFGVFREGQNSMIYALLKLIANGRNAATPQGRD